MHNSSGADAGRVIEVEGFRLEITMTGGTPQDWVYAASFAAVGGEAYLATYSGKVIEMEDALASKISLMPKEFSWDANPPVMPREDGSYPIAVPGLTRVV